MISVGAHIDKKSFCFAELALEQTQPKIISFEEKLFENPDSIEDKKLVILRHIDQIKKKRKSQVLRFCYGLSQSSVTSFFVDFPFKEKFKILKTLPFQIEDKTPFRSDKVFFDARIGQIKNKSQSFALCFVTPEDNIRLFLERVSPLKNPSSLLSCEGSALANLLEFWNKPLSQSQNPSSDSLYIYLGAENSQLLFYKEGYLRHISVLDWSVTGIIQEMKKLYRLSEAKAWEEFFAKSFVLTELKGWTKEQVFFSNLIKKQIQLLIPKLELLKLSLEAEWNGPISTAVLFGPGAVIKNLSAFLSEKMSINISRLKSLPALTGFDFQNHPSKLIALGLALEGFKNSPYQGINFLQSLRKESFSFFPKKWRKPALAFLLCFILFSFYSFIRQKEGAKILDKAQAIFLSYGKRIAYMPEDEITPKALNSFLEKEKSKKKTEEMIKDKLNRPYPMDYLKKMTQKLGSAGDWDLKIIYLKMDGSSAEIKGWAKASSLEKFKTQLKGLAKGTIKDNSLTDSSKIEAKQSLPEEAKALKVSSGGEEAQAFFSYIFEFKKAEK